MSLSPDGCMLVTFSNMGNAQVWDLDTFKLIQTLRDHDVFRLSKEKRSNSKEQNIDEFYVGAFHPTGTKIVIGGKLKDRTRWSEEDNDNHVMTCPLKVCAFQIIQSTRCLIFWKGKSSHGLMVMMKKSCARNTRSTIMNIISSVPVKMGTLCSGSLIMNGRTFCLRIDNTEN